ncbi:MAG: polyphosphate polymerase domain-containing protein [Solobacterium sp.]|nr:polyphosphate polymerase domain-containing protein [Solobacterium sp.]
MNQEVLFEATMMRVEHKYPMTRAQAEEFMRRAQPHLIKDFYPEYDLHNIYYDTDDNALIINCLDHPQYKEKLRLRTYGEPNESTPCFLEIKKKFRDTGIKRRIAMNEADANRYFHDHEPLKDQSQIAHEIDYLVKCRGLKEKMFIAYHRKAFSGIEENDLRITFDTDICYRLNDLSLHMTGEEKMITDEDDVLMEIKVSDRYPVWLTEILTDMKLYRQTFSKYGTIYSDLITEARSRQAHVSRAVKEPVFQAAFHRKENAPCLVQF